MVKSPGKRSLSGNNHLIVIGLYLTSVNSDFTRLTVLILPRIGDLLQCSIDDNIQYLNLRIVFVPIEVAKNRVRSVCVIPRETTLGLWNQSLSGL